MEPFDQTADEVYATRGKSSLSGQVRQVCRNMVQGDKCKDLRTEFSIRERDDSHHYAPFWIASLKYKGETFTYVRAGSGGHLSDGSRPVDEERKKAVEAQMKPVWIAGIVTVVVGLTGFIPFFMLVPFAVAGILGLPLTIFMYFRAKKNQKAILAKSHAVRQKLLEKVQQSGGMRADGGLSLSEADVARAQEEVAAETEDESEDDSQA